MASYPPKNGGLRKYTFDASTKELLDVEGYYYSVRESNATGKLEWRQSWKASDDGVVNRTRDTYGAFLDKNLCEDSDMIGAAGSAVTLDACFRSCVSNSKCEYFGWEADVRGWCILFSSCTPRTGANASSAVKYTTYSINSSSSASLGGLTVARPMLCQPLAVITCISDFFRVSSSRDTGLKWHHLVVGGWWCHVGTIMHDVVYHLCMFERVMCMFEHAVRTGAICARHGAAGRHIRLQKSTTPVIIGH